VSELPQQLHEAMIAATQPQRLIGHIARDSTAILVRERFPETAKQKEEAKRAKKAAERGKRISRQRHQKLERMLKELRRQCDIGMLTKINGLSEAGLKFPHLCSERKARFSVLEVRNYPSPPPTALQLLCQALPR
jgi:hypothetical protein